MNSNHQSFCLPDILLNPTSSNPPPTDRFSPSLPSKPVLQAKASKLSPPRPYLSKTPSNKKKISLISSFPGSPAPTPSSQNLTFFPTPHHNPPHPPNTPGPTQPRPLSNLPDLIINDTEIHPRASESFILPGRPSISCRLPGCPRR